MTARRVGGHVEIEAEEARAGQTGLHARYILVYSMILVAAGMGLAALIAPFW